MPPKAAAEPLIPLDPARKVTMSVQEFLDMQDKLANTMATYRNIAVKILEASSNSLAMTTDALTNLHSFTLSTLALSDVKPDQIPSGQYPTIAQLLKHQKEKIKDFDQLRLPHLGTGDKAKRASKPKKQKDPDAPKRPETAYLRFANAKKEDYREKMRKENPAVTNGEIAKQLTSDWHGLGEPGQKYWKDVYQVELQEYNRKKAEYEKRTGKRVDEKVDEIEPAAGGAAAVVGRQQSSIEEGIANALSGSASDDSSDSSDTSSDDSPSPPPAVKAKPPTPKAAAKAKGAKLPEPLSPTAIKDDGKKKRKHGADDDDADKKKSKKSKKDDKAMSNIDPRLEKLSEGKKTKKRKGEIV